MARSTSRSVVESEWNLSQNLPDLCLAPPTAQRWEVADNPTRTAECRAHRQFRSIRISRPGEATDLFDLAARSEVRLVEASPRPRPAHPRLTSSRRRAPGLTAFACPAGFCRRPDRACGSQHRAGCCDRHRPAGHRDRDRRPIEPAVHHAGYDRDDVYRHFRRDGGAATDHRPTGRYPGRVCNVRRAGQDPVRRRVRLTGTFTHQD